MSTLDSLKRAKIHSPESQSTTFVELFFDLVFVFALTQLTSFTAEHLDAGGVARALLIFWFIWWVWTQWTWTLNAADTEHGLVRGGTLLAAAVALVMAVSVGDAFNEGGGVWFAAPYVGVRVIGLVLFAGVAAGLEGLSRPVVTFGALSTFGLALALVGGFLDPDVRVWLWVGVVLLDVVASTVAGNFEAGDMHTEHFAERHGLFVIIALGESLIVAATAVARADRSGELVAVGVGAILVTCLLWWIYFGWFRSELEARLGALHGTAQAALGRDAYSLLHMPMIAGIVGVAVAFEEIGRHPDEVVPDEVLGALGVGIALILLASAASWMRAYRRPLWARLVAPGVVAVALVAGSNLDPWLILLLVVAVLAMVVGWEEWAPRESVGRRDTSDP